MSKNLLITGGSGFIGRNLKEALTGRYHIFAPSHDELELMDYDALQNYVKRNRIDVIVHAAIHVPMIHGAEDEFYNDMRMFMNLEKVSRDVEKLLYFGSGAEYDKRFDISMAREEEIGRSIPVSRYGLAKYIMNGIAAQSDNIYNLRLFGIFGKYELWQLKFISNLCCKAVFNLPLTIRKDCCFDFLYVNDLAGVICWFIENKPDWHDYNVVHGKQYRLTELAEMVLRASGKELPITLLSDERGLDYSACSQRLSEQIPGLVVTPMQQAVDELYSYYSLNSGMIDSAALANSR